MTATAPRAVLAALAAVAVATVAVDASADRKQACLRAHESGQALRREGKLRASRDEVLSCLREDCPSVVRADCSRLLEQVEASIPTVVFEGKDRQGQATTAVRVVLDGAALLDRLDGRAQMIDPGEHSVRFESGGDVREVRVVVAEGQKNSVVLADFTEARPPPPAPSPVPRDAAPPPTAGRETTGFVVAGIGLASLAAGTVFGLIALGAAKDATCSSPCPANSQKLADANSAFDRSNTLGWVSNVTLALGVIGAAVGGYLVFTAPSGTPRRAARARLPAPIPIAGGAAMTWGAAF